MSLYLLVFMVAMTLATAVLVLVALAAASKRGGDRTALGQKLRAVMAHLNGEARAPKLIRDLLTPATPTPPPGVQSAERTSAGARVERRVRSGATRVERPRSGPGRSAVETTGHLAA